MGSLSGARIGAAALALACALVIGACGGGDDSEAPAEPATLTADEVVAAFEEAAGGYEFEKVTSLVSGTTAYGPHNSADVDVVEPINSALGEGSLLWQVFVFDGADTLVDEEAAKEVGSASNTFDEVEPGVFFGDHDIAYIAKGNVVIVGPVLGGDTGDPTLVGWKGVLDSL
jgi:hypothetical protein